VAFTFVPRSGGSALADACASLSRTFRGRDSANDTVSGGAGTDSGDVDELDDFNGIEILI
jgi:hypothetical protein